MLNVEELKSIVGDNVKYYREKAGYTQDTLAEKCGVSGKTIQKIEKGESWPEGETYLNLINIFGLDAPDLLISKNSQIISRKKVLYLFENVNQMQTKAKESIDIILSSEAGKNDFFTNSHIEPRE